MRLVYIAFGWVAGIVLAANNTSGSSIVPLIWLGLAGLSLLALWLSWQEKTQRYVAIALVAFACGGLRMSLVPTTSQIALFNNTGGLTVQGVVIAEPDRRDDRTQLRVAAETVTRAGQTYAVDGLVLVRVPRHVDVRYGDRVNATGLLITPAEFDTFSYADFLGRTGVFSIMRQASVEVVASGEGSPVMLAILDLKGRAAQHIAHSLPEPQAALLTGILLGNENNLAPEVRDAFSRAGASHIIAISGFNMVILSGAVMGLLERARVRPRTAAVIGIAVILLYTIFVGANAAVVRAAVMSSLLVIGAVIRRKTYVPASLAFVAVIMSLHNPTVLWDVSFQLSFFATLGLALYVDPLSRHFDHLLARYFPPSLTRTISGFLSEPLIVTIAAQITTLPLIVLYFSRLSLVALPINLLIIPAQALLLILGLIATLIAFIIPALAQILYWYDLLLLSWTTGIVRLLAELPFADVEFHVDPRLIVLYYALLIGVALMQATQPVWVRQLGNLLQKRAVTTATALTGFATILLISAAFISRPDNALHVWLLDAGHSNAVLVQTPGGAQVLVDGGRFPSRLLTALGDRMSFNDREIEVLVLTQPDENEFAALPAVLDRYATGVVLTNGYINLGEAYETLQQRLADRNVIEVRAGYQLELDDGVIIDILHPQTQPQPGDSLDDFAIALRVRYGEASFLLPSDLSIAGQQIMLENGHWPLSTVLQLPQHGSIRSLDAQFLSAVQPQVAVVQADPANLRGDPDPDVLNELGEIPLYRTDEHGTIHLWTDGESLWVESER